MANKTLIVMNMRLLIVMSMIVISASQNWKVNSGISYDTVTKVLLGESSQSLHENVEDVGFQITSKIEVLPVWRDPKDSDTIFLSLKVVSPQLWIKSRKAPKPEGFVKHNSRISEMPQDPILFLWKKGEIKRVFASTKENLSSMNLKRGFVSLFQYRDVKEIVKEIVNEVDASGECEVSYQPTSARSFEKTKSFCKRYKREHPNPIMGVEVKGVSVATYNLSDSFIPTDISEFEFHEMSLTARPEARSAVTSYRILESLPGIIEGKPIKASTYTEVISQFDSQYMEVPIESQNEYFPCPDTGCVTLTAALEDNFKALESSSLGTSRSASAFLKIVPLIKNSSADALIKVLKSPKNHDILPQLFDLLGSASTLAAHQAAMKYLLNDETGENTERYLMALGTATFPDPDIIKDVLRRSEETIANDKVSETLALTAAAMAKRHGATGVIEKVRDSLELGLYACTGEPCQMKFLRALGNLGTKSVIPVLLKFTNSSKALSVIAWKAIGKYPYKFINHEIKNLALRTFLQLEGQRVDSSVRTLAVNVLLDNHPFVEDLRQLLRYLGRNDPVYEVKKYLLQRCEQLSDTDPEFRAKFEEAVRQEAKVMWNYNTLGQRGLSTAFTRNFLNSVGANGTLVTIQEISSGLLKRGIVDIVLESGSAKYTVFSLGLFAGGLNSFVSSSDQEENEVPSDNDVATAGMELSFLDVTLRPFVFFSGQGELMGHAWSGTASERTSALGTTVNLQNHQELIPLGSGFVAQLDVEGAISVDLAGQVQLSLWSRNAKSLVEMGAGIAIKGSTKVLTDFVRSRSDFFLSLEPKLELATDVDFSGQISLCMRSSQPQTVIRHNVYKVERIPGSKHRLRKTRRIRFISPARSYLLNRKNNEMCSKIFD